MYAPFENKNINEKSVPKAYEVAMQKVYFERNKNESGNKYHVCLLFFLNFFVSIFSWTVYVCAYARIGRKGDFTQQKRGKSWKIGYKKKQKNEEKTTNPNYQ